MGKTWSKKNLNTIETPALEAMQRHARSEANKYNEWSTPFFFVGMFALLPLLLLLLVEIEIVWLYVALIVIQFICVFTYIGVSVPELVWRSRSIRILEILLARLEEKL